ncbi:MAG: protein kinase [Vicinamibacterales bacterium]
MPSPNLPRTIGRYEVIDRHGSGGMGVVYRARDPKIGRQVAIKVLHVVDDGLHDRFLQEARSAGSLKHPSIVTIYDYGDHDGQPYIVMEFVEGVTLADKIRGGVQMPLSRKFDLFLELLSGLDYAHHQGVIHRDVKPVNIMEEQSGALKILDFGIARVAGSTQTLRGTLLGTPNYMSPEQVEGKPVDARSDIFAAGLVFYELLSYRQAFSGETINRVMNAVARERPTPLRELCPDLDLAVEAIVNKALQKDPNRRYQSMASMALDVRRVKTRLESEPDELPDSTVQIPSPRRLVPARTPAPASTPAQTPGRTPRPDGHREQLSKRRAEAIAHHVHQSNEAMRNNDVGAALESAEQAALLDPDDERVVVALERARAALDDQRISAILLEARAHLDAREADQALEAVSRALDVDPGNQAALDLQNAARQWIAEQRERLEAIASALGRARASLAAGNLESAIRAASEVLTQDPTHQEGHALTQQALRELDARREREAADRAARAFVTEQRRVFASGQWNEALTALAGYWPPHDVVSNALELLRAERADVEERLAAEARQREAEGRAAAQIVTEQRAQFAAGRRREAVEALERFRPRHDVVSSALATLRKELADLEAREAEERRRREQVERAARAVVVVQRMEFAAGRRAEAISALERHSPRHEIVDAALATMREELAEIEARIAAEQLQRKMAEEAAGAFVATQRREFDKGRRREALAAMHAYAPPHEIVTLARAELMAQLIEAEAREAEERRQRERELAEVRGLVAAQQLLFSEGRRAEAIAALERHTPPHDVVTSALVGMRLEHAHIQAREEEERRQREAADQAAREVVARQREVFAAGQRTEAIAALSRHVPPHPLVAQALSVLREEDAAIARKAAEEEERRRALAEIAERKRQEEHAAQLARTVTADARAVFDAGRRPEAIAALERAQPHQIVASAIAAMKAEHAAIVAREAEEAAQRAREEERRRREAEQRAKEEAQRAREAEARRVAEEERLARLEEQRRAAEQERLAREAEAQRQREVAKRLGDARAHVQAGQLEKARSLLDSVVALGGASAAQAVADELNRAVEARHQQEQRDLRAAETVSAARRRFEEDDPVGALDLLLSFSPSHPMTTAAYQELLARTPLEEPAPHPPIDVASDPESDDESGTRTRQYLDACVIAEDALSIDDLAAATAALDRAEALLPQSPEVSELRRRLAERTAARVTPRAFEAPSQIELLRRPEQPEFEDIVFRTMAPTDDTGQRKPAGPPPAVAPRRPDRTYVIVAVVAVVVLAGAWYFLSRSPASAGSQDPVAQQGANLEAAEPVSSEPMQLPSAAGTASSSPAQTAVAAEAKARGALERRQYLSAVQTARDALARAPGDATLTALITEIVNSAEIDARSARDQADAAGGAATPEYAQAVDRVTAAAADKNSAAPERAARAVAAFVDASTLFGKASKEEPSTVVPTLPSGGEVADRSTVVQLLSAFAAAQGGLTLTALQTVYPTIPADAKARFEQFRRDYVRCEYSYESIQLLTASDREASAKATRVETCTNRANQEIVATLQQQILIRRVRAAGTWAIADVVNLQ